jgi:hypothetical protein
MLVLATLRRPCALWVLVDSLAHGLCSSSVQVPEPRLEEEAIRGFRVIRHQTTTYDFDQPGHYTLPQAGVPATTGPDGSADPQEQAA